jgi:hypothetical protein
MESPSARARKFRGTFAATSSAYELEEESDVKDVSDSEPDPDSESVSESEEYSL